MTLDAAHDLASAEAVSERLLSLATWCRQVHAVATGDPRAMVPDQVTVDDLVRIVLKQISAL